MGCLTYFLLKKNKHIISLKKWVSGRVFLFCKQCFNASQTCIFTELSFSFGTKKKKSGPNKETP